MGRLPAEHRRLIHLSPLEVIYLSEVIVYLSEVVRSSTTTLSRNQPAAAPEPELLCQILRKSSSPSACSVVT